MSQAPPIRGDVPDIFKASAASPNRLIHLIPDELARAVPNHALFSYPKTAQVQDGFVDVSSKQFANAINRTSWYLSTLLGVPRNFETVCYMGPNDIRYFLFMFAAIKVGYKMLFLSPRNQLDGHLNVLDGTQCKIFLRANGTNVDHILIERHLRTSTVPELEELLNGDPVPMYPYSKSFDEACMDPCLVLHTTGSTGLPKPITWHVGILSTYEAWRTIPPVDDFVPTTVIYQQSRRMYTSLPLFHTSGINAGITWSLLLGVTLVYGSPHVVPNAAYVDEMHKHGGVDASISAPSIYEELSCEPESLDRINKLHYVVASGAPLSMKAGTIISRHTRIISNLGATETACLQRLAPSIDDWAYFFWHPTHSGIEMREVEDGLYELFLVKNSKLKLFQGIFNTFPSIEEWSMNDVYSRHPDPAKPFLFMYRGRRDDVIVLSNGEKIAPALMETALKSHPLVKGAMVVGRAKFQPAVLIDLFAGPPQDAEHRHRLVESLRPFISEANKFAPAHGQLDHYHVLFATPKKPVAYLGQDKVSRTRTYNLYEEDIEALYASIEDDSSEQLRLHDSLKVDFTNRNHIMQCLKLLLAQITNIEALGDDDDLFTAGVDSLQVIKLARELRLEAKACGMANADQLRPLAVYLHSSVSKLATWLHHQTVAQNGTNGFSSTNGSTDSHDDADIRDTTTESMRHILELDTQDLPALPISMAPPQKDMTIMLTGSTGSLGSHLLDSLYQNENVIRIVCLNRAPDAEERHKNMCEERGSTQPDPQRVEFLQADLSKPRLGLEDSVYDRLLSTVTHIIHNQWPVNFNWALASFRPYILGVRHLVDFSIASSFRAFILFISSVSSVGSWTGEGSVPEQPMQDLSMASEMGYGQSKLISEKILDEAARVSGVRSAVCRVGIIAGPVEKSGVWSKHEYVPSIIISSAYLGAFPENFPSRENIQWIPVDILSRILSEIMISSSGLSEKGGTTTYHVINSQVTTWSAMLPKILSSYPGKRQLKVVTFSEWLNLLGDSLESFTDSERNPALKLFDFYKDCAAAGKKPQMLDLEEAKKASKTLRHLNAVNGDWISRWMQQWHIEPGPARWLPMQ